MSETNDDKEKKGGLLNGVYKKDVNIDITPENHAESFARFKVDAMLALSDCDSGLAIGVKEEEKDMVISGASFGTPRDIIIAFLDKVMDDEDYYKAFVTLTGYHMRKQEIKPQKPNKNMS